MPYRNGSPAIVLLAAGEGSRFGGAKQLASIGGEPMVRRVARILLETHLPLFVVTGAHAAEVEAVLVDLPLDLVGCERWSLGMGDSLATGVRAVVGAFPLASAVLVCLADQPLLTAAQLRAMLERHQAMPERIVATQHAGIQGPPVLFPSDCFAALAALSGPHGARTLLRQEAARVEVFASPAWVDVDTLQDLEQVRSLLTGPDDGP